MSTANLVRGILAAAVAGLMSNASTVAQAQDSLSIANNDSVMIDASTFKVSAGKARGDLTAQLRMSGARELGQGAIVFRAADRLYIIDGGATQQGTLAHNAARPFAYDPSDPRREVWRSESVAETGQDRFSAN